MGHFSGKIGNAHAPCHVTGWWGSSKTTYLESATKFAYSLYNFYGATTTIKGSLHGSTHIVKLFSVDKRGSKNGGFSRITECMLIFLFSNGEKAHRCAEPRPLTYYA